MASFAFPGQILAAYTNVKHISAVAAIFPTIHELKPDVILFDYAHMSDNMERVLRRLHTNTFYKNIKLCCYKQTENTVTDSTLKVLGIDHIIYGADLQKTPKSSAALNAINNLVNASLLKLIAGPGPLTF